MAAATVEAVLAAVPASRLVAVHGGDKRNAIARECAATVAVRERVLRRGLGKQRQAAARPVDRACCSWASVLV